MLERLIETGRCYGKEINVEKSEMMRISRQPPQVQIAIYQTSRRMWNIINILIA